MLKLSYYTYFFLHKQQFRGFSLKILTAFIFILSFILYPLLHKASKYKYVCIVTGGGFILGELSLHSEDWGLVNYTLDCYYSDTNKSQ